MINNFQSIKAASKYAKVSEHILMQDILDGTVREGICYVFADQKDQVLKKLQEVYKAYTKET